MLKLFFGCLLIFFSANTFSQNDLKEVKKLLAGKWKVNKKIATFSFETDSTGLWEVENVITTSPLFIIYQKENIFYLGSVDMLGYSIPYPYEIIVLNEKKLVLKDQKESTLHTYKRK